jgi:hypothetical protein
MLHFHVRRTWSGILLATLMGGCGLSHDRSVAPDASVPNNDAGRDAVPVDAGRAADAGTAPDPGRASDAAIVFPTDASMSERAGSVECGSDRCDLSFDGCLASCERDGAREPACVAKDGEARWPAEECPSGEQFPRYWLMCDGPEDCTGGDLCWLLFGSLGQYAFCMPSGSERLCHDAGDCVGGPPQCTPSVDLPGYSTCRTD